MQKARPKHDEDATRVRVLDAACSVFAEVGYRAATVREICAKARVNVASVNYHFGDKLGLYTEVLSHSAGAETQSKIRAAVAGSDSPEEALRAFVRGMFDKMCRADRPAWHVKIMIQEMANSTPALPSVVDQVIRPQYDQLCQLIGGILSRPPSHRITRLCVHSLIGQVTHYAHGRAVISQLWPQLRMTTAQRNEVADHIVQFTLAGLKAMENPRATAKKPSRT
jgi:AcrR family transcriptional regulator